MESVNLINNGIILAYVLVGTAVLSTIIFGLIKIFSNSQNLVKTIFAIGGVILLGAISYILASGDLLPAYKDYKITETQSKNVGIGLFMFYFLGAGAIASVVFGELSNILKNNVK